MSNAVQNISPASVPLGQSCIVLDVRTDVEHREVSLKQAHHHVPLDQLNPARFMQENKVDAARPVYILCRSGRRATQAAESFMAAGHGNVHVVEGGIIACEAAGIPVRKEKVMSLERQVRITAGALVVIGVVLGALVSPWFYILSGFAGAGLVFAGITDTCAMGLLLANAPWNRNLKTTVTTAASCAAPAAACQVSAPETPAVRMPAGTAFYSPASGIAPGAMAPQATAPVKNNAGGCS